MHTNIICYLLNFFFTYFFYFIFIFFYCYLITSYFQARNCPVKALVISVLRQGALLIPCLYLLNCFWKLWGVVWANTAACILAALIAVGFYLVQKKIDGKKEIFYRNA